MSEPRRSAPKRKSPPRAKTAPQEEPTSGPDAEPTGAAEAPPPRSPPPRPLWRLYFDFVEQQLGPPLEALFRRGEFATILAAGTRAEARTRRELDRRLSQWWHFWNLPAYTDVRRSAERLSAVERRLSDLSEESDRSS